jgi:hypothetical protein
MNTGGNNHLQGLRNLEGHRLCLSLVDGSRLDDAILVSAGRGTTSSVWLEYGGMDLFILKSQVVETREANPVIAA